MILLMVIGAGTMIASGVAVYFYVASNKITKANYDSIKDGMTAAEVENILGKGTERVSASVPAIAGEIHGPGVSGKYTVPATSSKLLVWEHTTLFGRTRMVTVQFLNDRVINKSWAEI
jgi:hypothetical protein